MPHLPEQQFILDLLASGANALATQKAAVQAEVAANAGRLEHGSPDYLTELTRVAQAGKAAVTDLDERLTQLTTAQTTINEILNQLAPELTSVPAADRARRHAALIAQTMNDLREQQGPDEAAAYLGQFTANLEQHGLSLPMPAAAKKLPQAHRLSPATPTAPAEKPLSIDERVLLLFGIRNEAPGVGSWADIVPPATNGVSESRVTSTSAAIGRLIKSLGIDTDSNPINVGRFLSQLSRLAVTVTPSDMLQAFPDPARPKGATDALVALVRTLQRGQDEIVNGTANPATLASIGYRSPAIGQYYRDHMAPAAQQGTSTPDCYLDLPVAAQALAFAARRLDPQKLPALQPSIIPHAREATPPPPVTEPTPLHRAEAIRITIPIPAVDNAAHLAHGLLGRNT